MKLRNMLKMGLNYAWFFGNLSLNMLINIMLVKKIYSKEGINYKRRNK